MKGEVASAAAQLAPAFEGVARSIALTGGFSLTPVEVTGPDLGRALAAWLGKRGVAAHVVEPLDEPQWRAVVATLLDAPEDAQAVMLLGPRRLAPGMAAGLSLVNQRRDMIVQGLARPLLWCGPRDFLTATWERAPDFWSIRALEHRVSLAARAPAESPLWPGVVARDAPERLRATLDAARAQGDGALSARVSVQLAEALLAAGEYDEARDVIDRAREGAKEDSDAWLAILAARTAFAMGDDARAEEALLEAERRSKSDRPSLGGLVAVARGNLAVTDDAVAAARAYEDALVATQATGDKRNEAVALADLGIALLASGDADVALAKLETARTMLSDVGDERGEARALVHVGRAHAALFDTRAAVACFEEALERVRAQGDERGEARVLLHVARTYMDAGDAEKAREDATRALELARVSGDARLVARAEGVLAQTRVAATSE